jgi:hypothetical protein
LENHANSAICERKVKQLELGTSFPCGKQLMPRVFVFVCLIAGCAEATTFLFGLCPVQDTYSSCANVHVCYRYLSIDKNVVVASYLSPAMTQIR